MGKIVTEANSEVQFHQFTYSRYLGRSAVYSFKRLTLNSQHFDSILKIVSQHYSQHFGGVHVY